MTTKGKNMPCVVSVINYSIMIKEHLRLEKLYIDQLHNIKSNTVP